MNKLILLTLLVMQAHADVLVTMKDGSQARVVGDIAKLEVVDTAVIPPPPTIVESPDMTAIPPATQIIDANLNKFTLVAGVVQKNGVAAGFTANVTLILYAKKTIYQQNSAGGWWLWDGVNWQTSSDPRAVTPPPVASGSFTVQNGKIIGPDGKPFVAHGININPEHMSLPILTTFPGINFIRLAVHGQTYPSPSTYADFISRMSSQGVVVEIENHAWPSPLAYTGATLTTESNWYASLASAYKSNPYVWFGTLNEPGDSGTYPGQGPAISAQHLSTYNAIRNTGSTAILMMDYFGGGNPAAVGINGGATPSTYAAMTNVVWDYHFYGWVSKMSTDQNVVNAALQGSVSSASGIQAVQSIKSKDGLVPVIIGEFGNSTDGTNIDANGDQVIAAVVNSGYGFAAWHWDAGGAQDQLMKNGVITAYGKQIQAAIAKAASAQTLNVMTFKAKKKK